MELSELCLGIVREFLASHQLHETLAALDQESPRHAHSVNKRSLLASQLGLEKMLKKNKDSATPKR